MYCNVCNKYRESKKPIISYIINIKYHKFNSDGELSLNKTIETHNMIIVVRALIYENNKYCPHVLINYEL